MKTLCKKIFAEKIIGFREGANIVISALIRIPVIADKMGPDIYTEDKAKIRIVFGVIAQIGKCILEFIKKLLYVALFIYMPYTILAHSCPNIRNNQELAIIYIFVILTTFCGSVANNTLLTMSDRDFLMIKVMLISPYMNFMGRLIYKMLSEILYYTIILCLFGVRVQYSIALGIITAALRPVGELIGILCFDYLKKVYDNRGTINGLIMAAAVIIAYTVPYSNRRVSIQWYAVTHPLFVIAMIIIGSVSMYFLWRYKHYRVIMREAMHIKREE